MSVNVNVIELERHHSFLLLRCAATTLFSTFISFTMSSASFLRSVAPVSKVSRASPEDRVPALLRPKYKSSMY